MKRAGCGCGPFNNCGVSSTGSMCECDDHGNCSEWILGDFALWELEGEKLQAAFEASTTKFYGKLNAENNLVLEEVGLFKAAGLQPGDVLMFVVEDLPQGKGIYSLKNDKEHLLRWQFTADELIVMFRREGQADAVVMKNPAN